MNCWVSLRLPRFLTQSTRSSGAPSSLSTSWISSPTRLPTPSDRVVEAEDDRVARLEADQRLEVRRRHRVRDRHQAEDHAHRLGDLGDLGLVVGAERAGADLPDQRVVDALGGDHVLERLVRGVADVRLLHGRLGQRRGVLEEDGGQPAEQGIHPVLGPVRELRLRGHRATHQVVDHRVGRGGEHQVGRLLGQPAQLGRRVARELQGQAEGGAGITLGELVEARRGDGAGAHQRVRDRGRRSREPVEEGDLAQCRAWALVAEHRLGVDLGKLELDAHLTLVDEVRRVSFVALGEDGGAGLELDLGQQLRDGFPVLVGERIEESGQAHRNFAS